MSDTSKTYNGWTNYETWNVALWIGNDQYTSSFWENEQAEECYREAVENGHCDERDDWTNDAANVLADRLKDHFEENMPKVEGCYADLLGAALSEVNWHEIAQNYIESLDRDEIEKDILPEPETEDDEDDTEEEPEGE